MITPFELTKQRIVIFQQEQAKTSGESLTALSLIMHTVVDIFAVICSNYIDWLFWLSSIL